MYTGKSSAQKGTTTNAAKPAVASLTYLQRNQIVTLHPHAVQFNAQAWSSCLHSHSV